MAATHLARTAPVPSLPARALAAPARPLAGTAPAPAGAVAGPVAALVGLVLAFLVVFVWRIGGVIVIVDQGHGLHSGDLLALPLALPAGARLLRWLRTAPR